jgi:hypothetical protein
LSVIERAGARLAAAISEYATLPLTAEKVAMRMAVQAGDGESASRLGRHVLQRLATMREGVAIAPASRRRAPPTSAALSEALRDCLKVMALAQLKPFLVFGSLLGAVRDHRFIPGDSDIDMGLESEAALAKAAAAAAGSPMLRVERSRQQAGSVAKFQLRHENGVSIDLKPFVWTGTVTTWVTSYGGLQLLRRFSMPITPVPFSIDGLDAWIPDCHEAMLAFQYGEWRTPDPAYHDVTSGPIHDDAHRAWSLAGAPHAIVAAIEAGRRAKAISMAQSMARQFPQDAYWAEIAGTLQRAR